MIDRADAIALSALYGGWRIRATRVLIGAGRSAANPDLVDVLRAVGAPEAMIDRVLAARQAVPDLLARAAGEGVEVIAWGDPRYPPALAAIPDPPAILWVRGRVDVLVGPLVAIVGSRAATSYGIDVAEELGRALAARGIVVVSGLARGIDSAAHRGALAAPGRTIAVLGSGVGWIYPPEHRPLSNDIVSGGGAIVSEFLPDAAPRAFHFPLRNRIISGLSLGVIVVEASERSGSLITVDCALDQGREVFAVPGSILTGRFRGCHALLRDGATLVETADDVLFALGLWRKRHEPRASADEAGAAGTAGAADSLLAVMQPGESYDVDGLAALCDCSPADLLTRLATLELDGAVRRLPGGWFVRSRRSC